MQLWVLPHLPAFGTSIPATNNNAVLDNELAVNLLEFVDARILVTPTPIPAHLTLPQRPSPAALPQVKSLWLLMLASKQLVKLHPLHLEDTEETREPEGLDLQSMNTPDQQEILLVNLL